MASAHVGTIALILLITLISGFGDSLGFLHSAKVWQNNRLILREVFQSGLGFSLGITAYWLVIKYMQQVGIVSAEMQTILWFSVTIIGVAIASGKFFQWTRIDQIIAVLVLGGIVWLLFKTGG